MSNLARIVGLLALAGTIVPPALFMMHWLESTAMMQGIMLCSAVAWFVAAPWWMKTE
jgi:hypothetical protein